MLSRKQTWRKIRSKSGEAIFKFCDSNEEMEIASGLPHNVINDLKVNSNSSNNNNNNNSSSSSSSSSSSNSNSSGGIISTSSSSSSGQNTPMKLRSALSMSDLSKALRRNEDARNLRFSSKVHVCLIPTRQDLVSVAKDVFWHTDDYQTFKREAVDELRAYLQLKGITAKEAIQALYQPQPEEYSYLRNLNMSKESIDIDTGMTRTGSSPAIMDHASADNSSMEISMEEAEEEDIKLGFKTDLDMNKELGTIKTPARQGGANSGAWTVQWQAPVPTV